MKEKNLRNKVAIVTGASRGIGAATAHLLAEEGALVVLAARSQHDLQEVARDIRARRGRVLAVPTDISDTQAAAELVEETEASFGPVDILVNNAAIIEPVEKIERISPTEWQKHMAINLNGPFFAIRAALPSMLARETGVIVNVGSGLSRKPTFGVAPYCTSKAGLWMLTRVLAEEVRGRGVQVYSIRPGAVDTSMQDIIRRATPEQFSKKNVEKFRRYKEEGMLIPPEEPGRLIRWLCRERPADLHGEEVYIFDAAIRERVGLQS